MKVGSRSRSLFKVKHIFDVFHVRSISLEPVLRFQNKIAQILTMMRRCADCRFIEGRLKVKVAVQGQTYCLTVFPVLSISLEPMLGFQYNFAQILNMIRQCAEGRFHEGQFKVKVTVQDQTYLHVFRVRSTSLEPMVGFQNKFAQILAERRFHESRFKVKVTVQGQTYSGCISCPLHIS